MKNLIKDKKIVIIDIETNGLYCGEDVGVKIVVLHTSR